MSAKLVHALTLELRKVNKVNTVQLVTSPFEASSSDYFYFVSQIPSGFRIAINNLLISRRWSLARHQGKFLLRTYSHKEDKIYSWCWRFNARAMIAQLYKKNTSGEDILRWGLAAAAATLGHPGTAFGNAHEIQRFYTKTIITQIP